MVSKKNFNLIVGIISLLLFIWIIFYAVPSLFVNLFNTYLGMAILLGIVILIGIYNKKFAFGLALIFIILYQFAHLTAKDNTK
jgi:hypothetical protein